MWKLLLGFGLAVAPVVLHFRFVRERGSWYLNEVVRPGRRGWTLSGRLARRP